MASKKRKKKEKQETLERKKEDYKPKQTAAEESDFILSTTDLIKERAAQVKQEPPKKETRKEDHSLPKIIAKPKEEPVVKHIKDIEHQIKKEQAIRKLIRPIRPVAGIKKTAELLGSGLHYFVELEEYITKDFFFGWLPKKIKKYLKIIVPLLVLIIILNLNLPVEPQIKKAIALFFCIAVLWGFESINMIVTALLIPVLAVILGLIKDSNPFVAFSNPIIYLLLAGLIIAQAFRKHELDKMIAVRVLAMSKGHVRRLLFYLMVITALMGMWMSNTATIALLVPVIITLSTEINHRVDKNYTVMFLLGAGFASSIGSISTILGSNPNAITAAFLNNVTDITFADWVKIGFPISLVLFIIAYFIILKLFAVKKEKIPIITLTKEAKKVKFTRDQRKLLMIFFPTIFLWLFGGELTSFLGLPPEFYRTEIIGLSAAILLFIFRIMAWEDVRRIPWEIFLLVGGGLTLGQILIDTGTASYIATNIFSILSLLPNPMIIIILVFISILLANFVNNSSATIILVPVLLDLSPLLNIDRTLLAMTAALATGVAPLTPIAMPAFSIIYGTGKVSRSEMIRTGLSIATICGLVLAAMIYLMNKFIFI